MFEVHNKFEIGEECWTSYRKSTKYKCPICEGKGKIAYNGYLIECRNCNGTGKLHNPKQYVLDKCKVRVKKIKVVNNGTSVDVRYVVEPVEEYISVKNRCESSLFERREEVEEYCIAVITGKQKPTY